MARFVPFRGSVATNPPGSVSKNLTGSILKKILVVAGCVVAFVWVQTAVAQAPHGGGHVGGGGHAGGGARVGAPVRGPRPGVFVGPRGVGPRGVGLHWVGPRRAGPRLGFGTGGFRFRQSSIHARRRVFFGAPFFRFGVGLGFNSLWWPSCGPSVGWGWGFDCYPVPFYGFYGYGYGGYGYGGYGFENYVAPQTYEYPEYVYGEEERDLIWLYLKDGTVYGVTDYWLVDGQMHFSMVEDDPTKPAEHAIPLDELDLPKTIDVNTRRGFRIVFRDEPWQEYLKHHPDLTPPDLPPPQ
jgi:hypothetical protein